VNKSEENLKVRIISETTESYRITWTDHVLAAWNCRAIGRPIKRGGSKFNAFERARMGLVLLVDGDNDGQAM